jgi:hypothetical protein
MFFSLARYTLDVEVYDADATPKIFSWDNLLCWPCWWIGWPRRSYSTAENEISIPVPQNVFNQLIYLICLYNRVLLFVAQSIRPTWISWSFWGYNGADVCFQSQAYVLMCKDSKELVAKIQEKLPVAEVVIYHYYFKY